jgi:hypothetical protein
LDENPKKPLAGIIVRLNKLQGATDARGQFVFPMLKPGRYELTVEAGSLGAGIVLADPRPLFVTIERGARQRIHVEAVHAARVEGEIALYTNPPAAILPPAGQVITNYQRAEGLARISVELKRADGIVRRTQSDGHGRFVFDQLVPGVWTLSFDEGAMPEKFRLEYRNLALPLSAGQVERLGVRVLPVQRSMKIIDQGWIDTGAGHAANDRIATHVKAQDVRENGSP